MEKVTNLADRRAALRKSTMPPRAPVEVIPDYVVRQIQGEIRNVSKAAIWAWVAMAILLTMYCVWLWRMK